MIGWLVLTLNSLYPHLIMQYNISPRDSPWKKRHPTVTVNKILDQEISFEMYKDNAVCANGAMYRKDVRGYASQNLWRRCMVTV